MDIYSICGCFIKTDNSTGLDTLKNIRRVEGKCIHCATICLKRELQDVDERYGRRIQLLVDQGTSCVEALELMSFGQAKSFVGKQFVITLEKSQARILELMTEMREDKKQLERDFAEEQSCTFNGENR